MFIYKYSQIPNNHRISYDQSIKICRQARTMHLGQLKLFFSELLFLTMYAKPGYKILYIGAAPGYHTTKLADLFPECQFDLWDPRQFDTESRPNIKIYQDFFTDVSASSYAISNEQILLMCDLRTMKIGQYKKHNDIEKMDDLVDDDMQMQARWCATIKPIQAYLKFRLPYEIPQIKYLTGTIYLQPYTKVSTEARLSTNDYTTKIIYDTKEFEEKLAYHNAYNRCQFKQSQSQTWSKIMDQYNLYNNWDNTFALRITHIYLKKIKGISSKKETVKLFLDIVKYHIKRYSDKYDVIFANKQVPTN